MFSYFWKYNWICDTNLFVLQVIQQLFHTADHDGKQRKLLGDIYERAEKNLRKYTEQEKEFVEELEKLIGTSSSDILRTMHTNMESLHQPRLRCPIMVLGQSAYTRRTVLCRR